MFQLPATSNAARNMYHNDILFICTQIQYRVGLIGFKMAIYLFGPIRVISYVFYFLMLIKT